MIRINATKEGSDLLFRLPAGKGAMVYSLSVWCDTSAVPAARTLEVQVKGTIEQYDYTTVLQSHAQQSASLTYQYTFGPSSLDGAVSVVSLGQGSIVVDRDGHIRVTILNPQSGDVIYRGVVMAELL